MKRLSRLLRNFYSVGSQRDAGCGFTIREGIVKLADGIWRGNEKFVLLPRQSSVARWRICGRATDIKGVERWFRFPRFFM